MSRKYTHVQELAEEVFRRKAAGETHRAIGEAFGLTKQQVRELVHREKRKARRAAAGYIPQPKGRPRKTSQTEEQKRENELALLRMQVTLLRNFLSEAGRR